MVPARREPTTVDLHGCTPSEATARLSRALHQARLRRDPTLEVITGRGLGNTRGEPVLRTRIEAWLDGPDGQRHGVRSHARSSHGGSIHVRLAAPSPPKPPRRPEEPEKGAGLEHLGPADLGLDGWDPSDEQV